MRQSFGFLFSTGSLSVTVPPRPFLLLTAEDRRMISDLARKFFSSGGA
jgi:phage gpG-like protein